MDRVANILPPEIWSNILEYCDLNILLNLRTTCRYFKNIINYLNKLVLYQWVSDDIIYYIKSYLRQDGSLFLSHLYIKNFYKKDKYDYIGSMYIKTGMIRQLIIYNQKDNKKIYLTFNRQIENKPIKSIDYYFLLLTTNQYTKKHNLDNNNIELINFLDSSEFTNWTIYQKYKSLFDWLFKNAIRPYPTLIDKSSFSIIRFFLP